MFSLYLHPGGVCQIQVSFTVNMERQICGIQGVHFGSAENRVHFSFSFSFFIGDS